MPDYPWKRFWCLRDGAFQSDFDGFLRDPEEEFGSIMNPGAKPFEALMATHFLGLVGEAGTGKTQTLEAEYANLGPQIAEAGDLHRHVSLRDVTSSSDLDREIFDADWFREWRSGRSALHLFLDALDESYPQIAHRILKRLSGLPLERFFARLTCRTASWPRIFDGELPALFQKAGLGGEPYAVYELLPLRRKDVELAAVAESIDPDHFIEEVKRKDVVPLAAKPMTLRFLIASYKATKALPPSSVSLYSTGCHDLATEMSDARRDARATGNLDAVQRLALAERIAAVMLLGNRQAIWTGEASEKPTTDAIPGDVFGVESLGQRKIEVSDTGILEVLNTGLFSARGESRYGWSHQTFGEFLAARYLDRHGFTLPQILSLLTTPGDSTRSVRPQLAGTAAWLASMNNEIQAALLEIDPAVLLLSDSATLGLEVRREVTSRLLERFERAELLDREGVLFRLYRKLVHPGIAEQIREAVAAPELSIQTKLEAIAIARACGSKELSGLFAELALDGHAPLQLRTSAANALAAVGDLEMKRRLIPLATGVPEDVDDDLKGAALHALWPLVLGTSEILQHLTRRRRPNLFGSYHRFLVRFPEEALDADIPLLLRWIAGFGKSYLRSHSFGELASRILDRAWSLADRPEVMAELPGALRNPQRLYFEASKANWAEPAQRRRLLVDHLVRSFDSREEAAEGWPGSLRVPIPADFEWMLSRLPGDSKERQPIWLELLARTFQIGDARHANALLEAAPSSDLIAAEFRWCLGSVDLKSESAEQGRKAWQEHSKWRKLGESRRRDGRAEIKQLLDLSDDGKTEAWCWVPWALAITPEGKDPGGSFSTDLPATPGWLGSDTGTRERIVRAATKFLNDSDPRTSEWLGTNTVPQSLSAAIAAFTLLHAESPRTLSELTTETWERWAPAVVSFPFFGEKSQAAIKLRQATYTKAPNVVLETLATTIDADDERSGWTFAVEHVDDFWDNRVADLLLTKLRKPGLKDGTFSGLLRKLLEHGSQEAAQFASDLVKGPLPLDLSARPKAISTDVMLLANDPESTWPLVWSHLSTDEAFARDFFVALASEGRPDHGKLFQSLRESQAVDLYVRLSEIFPHSRDRMVSGIVGPDDEARMFRDSLLAWLQNRGTQQACDAIASIAQRLPQLQGLKWVLLEANQARRRKAPGWPAPAEILDLAAERSRRLVLDAADLLDVLIETLAQLEKQLQGETPAARDLWDKKTGSKTLYLPKPEEDISDYVKRHLDREVRERGVIVNREVRIHRGQRTDIHVDAVVESKTGSLDAVSVIIEVKGCWNPELLTAMKTQLVDKYLVENRCQHGLYLAGWFDCKAWDPGDPRRKSRPKLGSIDELKGAVASQATELSTGGLSIRALVLDARLKR